MLAWLILAHQAVILCNSFEARFFYQGKVYSRAVEVGFRGLHCKRQQMAYCLIGVDQSELQGPEAIYII